MIPEPSRLSDKEFDQFAELIWQKARIHLKPAKITLLSNRLRRRLRVLELDDYKAYLEYIKAPANASELVNMLDVVTTNETYFFRNMLHWNALLEGSIVKDILKNRKPRVMKAWSAGCSSGEEPYNLAIVLTEAMKTQLHFDFSVEATDLSTNMIKKAKKGEYSGRTLEKIPSNFMKRYFEPVEENEVASIFTLRDDIKKKVNFRQHNLFLDDALTNVDLIFCRNVMIYFKKEDQEYLVNKFYQSLNTPGYLFIGHSESLHIFDTAFKAVKINNAVVYKKE